MWGRGVLKPAKRLAASTARQRTEAHRAVNTMAPMPSSIDVVIVAYNRYELTDSCLRHLRAQTIEHRVILVDNGSTDDTRARLEAEWPAVHVERFDREPRLRARRAIAASRPARARSWCCSTTTSTSVRLPRASGGAARTGPARSGSVAALMLQPGERLIDSAGLAADVTLGGFPRLQGLSAGQAPARATGARRPGRHGGRLPPLGVGAGRRPGRGDLRLHGGPRPRPAPAQRRLEVGRSPRTPSACTSGRRRTATAPPSSGATAASDGATCCAATGCCADARRRARSPPRPSWSSATSPSRATWRRCSGRLSGWRAARRAPRRLPAPPAEAIDRRTQLSRLARAAAGGVWTPRRLIRASSSADGALTAARPAVLFISADPVGERDGGAGHPLLGAGARAARARRR